MTLRATQPRVIIKSIAYTIILYMYNSCQNDRNNFLYWITLITGKFMKPILN